MSELFQGLPEALQRALADKGFTELTSVQKAVADADSLNNDLRISSQTGSGKTVAVGIAIARELIEAGPRGNDKGSRTPSCLLLTPTRELAAQVQRELSWLLRSVPDASVEVVTGGTSVFGEKKLLAQGPRVVVGTPGRALDHLKTGAFIGDNVRLVVLDEADQMLDMGFRDELTSILEALPNRGRTHLLSATFSGEVLAVAQRYQKTPIHIQGSQLGTANVDIEHIAHVVPNNHRYDALVNILLLAHAKRSEDGSGRTLVFTRTRADTVEVAERLQRDGVAAETLSGDLAQAQRTRTLEAFRSGRITTLVATDVAARGLDVQGVDLVIHFEPPTDPDSFTHRSGRTGRAGQKGTSILLLPPQARRRVERLLQDARIKPNWAPVPAADKVEKAYAKLGRKRIFSALDVEPTAEQLSYAQKLCEEHPPERVIASIIGLLDLKPPCPPREISGGFAPEHAGHARERSHNAGPHAERRGPAGDARFARRPSGSGSQDHGAPSRDGSAASSDAGPRVGGGPPARAGGFAPREGGFKGAPREGGFAPREGGFKGAPREGGFAPREGGFKGAPREGGFKSAPRDGGYAPREGGFAPREGGFVPKSPRGPGAFAPRDGKPRPASALAPRAAGGFVPRAAEGPREGGGFQPRPFKKAGKPRPAGPRTK